MANHTATAAPARRESRLTVACPVAGPQFCADNFEANGPYAGDPNDILSFTVTILVGNGDATTRIVEGSNPLPINGETWSSTFNGFPANGDAGRPLLLMARLRTRQGQVSVEVPFTHVVPVARFERVVNNGTDLSVKGTLAIPISITSTGSVASVDDIDVQNAALFQKMFDPQSGQFAIVGGLVGRDDTIYIQPKKGNANVGPVIQFALESDNTPPFAQSPVVVNNGTKQVPITFTEAMGPGAFDMANYALTYMDQGNPVNVPIAAMAHSNGFTTATLLLTAQNALDSNHGDHTVTITTANVKNLAGVPTATTAVTVTFN